MAQLREKTDRLPKAYSPTDLMRTRFTCLDFTGQWAQALGRPATCGVWIVWGASGSGKTSFAMQLAKELARHGRVIYNSLEQGASLSMQETMARCGMQEVNGSFLLVSEDLETLSVRLSRKRSPEIVIIDSLQYTGLNYDTYKRFKARHPRKLIIFISHADGREPAGQVARKIQYDAEMKILVEGYRAMSKGRYIPTDGAYYTVWAEGAARYWTAE